jgi:hypothetical protein
MRTVRWLVLAILLIFLLASCDIQPPTPLPTLTPTPVPTATATIDWFPVTDTPTPRPTLTRTPTPNLRPDLGGILVEDDFTSEEEWVLSTAEGYNIAIANGHLTLVLSRPERFIYSIRREPSLDDFYIEITASPNLCRGEDEYGLMVRTTPALTHYRFALSCDGRAKVTRVSHNSARVIVPWTKSPVIPSLVPGSSRLAVWANGQDIRFFVNGEYLFSIVDTALVKGTVGVFIRTAGDTPVSVNFSDLVIRSISP